MINIYKAFGIYRITNTINGNSYIGKTGVSFGDRWDCHRAQLNGGYHDNVHLQRAWTKYGAEAFEFAVVEVADDVGKLNDLEKMYIKQYRDLGACYNMSDGGDGGFVLGTHLSEDAKRRIGDKNRINMTGRKLSKETRQKMSDSQNKRYARWTPEDRAKHGKISSEKASGYRWSDESKDRFAEIQKTRPNGAKYNVDLVHKIRYLHENNKKTVTEISNLLNIPRASVYNIATYRRWKNV